MMNQNNISLEKVIKALERCIPVGTCEGCPYTLPDGGTCESLDGLLKDALALLKSLSAFKAYFDDLYGKGLELANYHLNGATEPFDNFYNSAMEEYENV